MNSSSFYSGAVIIFARYPEPGSVKTRIGNVLGHDFAFSLYSALLLDLMDKLSGTESMNCHYYVYPPERTFDFAEKFLIDQTNVHPQDGEDLGERMYNAFTDRFMNGSNMAVCIGTDLPGLLATNIENAFEILFDNDSVLGPSFDGGYYLIGFKKDTITDIVFRNMVWSNESVLRETSRRLETIGLTFNLLDTLRDIDEVSDLVFFKNTKMADSCSRLTEIFRQYHTRITNE